MLITQPQGAAPHRMHTGFQEQGVSIPSLFYPAATENSLVLASMAVMDWMDTYNDKHKNILNAA
eukprot:1134947-Pelagomonas_calceolata.AAC.4